MPTGSHDEAPSLGIDHAHLRTVVHQRVFGDADPVRIGRYTVLERVGSGAMGVVYAAYDNDLDRKIAVKVLRTGGTGTRRRLLREAQALARVSHPAVCQIYEVGEHDGEVFLAMELVPGTSMRDWLEEGARAPERIVSLFIEAARGLSAAHEKGVVHRDVKPDNIIVGEDGHAHVVDFGLAIGVDTEVPSPGKVALADDGLTQTGTTLGTPAYMAPEQLGGGAAHPLADQFALCVSLYEALTGLRPFEGMTVEERQATGVLETLRFSKANGVAPKIQRAVLQGLSADPSARHESLSALADALEGSTSKRRWVLGGLAATGMAATLLVGARLGAWLEPSPEPPAVAPTIVQPEVVSDAEIRLLLAEARNFLRSDPTAAWRRLAKLPDDPAVWTEEVAGIAAFAYDSGVADSQRAMDRYVTTMAAGTLELDPDACELRFSGADGVVRWRAGGQCRDGKPRPPEHVGSTRILFERDGALVLTDFETDRVLTDLEGDWSTSLGDDGSVALVSGTELRVWRPGASAPLRYELAEALGGDPDGVSKVTHARFGSADPTVLDIGYQDSIGGTRQAMVDTRSGQVDALGWSYTTAASIGPGRAIVRARDGSLHRWRRGKGVELLDPTTVRAFTLSADGTWLAALTYDKRIVTWELASGRRRQIEVPDTHWTALEPRGPYVAIVVDEAVYVVTRTGQIVRRLHHGSKGVMVRWVDDTTIETHSSETRRTWTIPRLPLLAGHRGGVDDLVFVDGDRLVSSGLIDRDIRLWDLRTGESELLREGPADVVTGFDVSPDHRFLLVNAHGFDSFVLDLETRERIQLHEPDRRAFFWSDSAVVYTPRVLRRDPETGEDVRVGSIYELDLDRDREVPRQVLPEAQRCSVLDATPRGEVATTCEDDRLRIWGRDGSVLWESEPLDRSSSPGTIPGLFDHMRLDPTGRYVWRSGGMSDGSALVMDRETGTQLSAESRIFDFAFHSTAPIVVGRDSQKLTTVSLVTGHARHPALAFDDDVRAVALSPDGSQIAYGTERGEIRIRTEPVPYEPEALRDFVRDNQPTIEP